MNRAYEIGPFRLQPDAGVLTYFGIPSALGGRGVAVLTALVEHANEYVSKASLIAAAWPDVVVEENNLTAQISAIRRVLAKTPGGERWVETLARRGYRFVGPVSKVQDEPHQEAEYGDLRSNLPESLTAFVGRERELVEVKRLLPTKRLLTLVGVGGIGKTRLALQVGAEALDAYRDGVWIVELASINDPSLVPSSVAQSLGVREVTDTPLARTLCAHFKPRKLLLILDNCEHLLEACAQLSDALLREAAGLTIIATSREPLRVAGEQIYSLPPLGLPDLSASRESMGSSEAVQLFVERAQRQCLGFSLTMDRVPAVAQLCVQLEGIPLALELAAARMRTLTLEEITARLNDRFKLLAQGPRTVLPRQQTLRATLDWSYDLLSAAERQMLCRVSVFAGGWTLEAAREVCMRENVDRWDALPVLASLVDKSLVLAEERGGTTRYRVLETVRQYAAERLVEGGSDPAQWQRRHLAYFLAMAEEAERRLQGPEQQLWLDRLEGEHDNLRSALGWSSTKAGSVEDGLRLSGALHLFWRVRGYLGEGRAWLSAFLAVTPTGEAAVVRERALRGAGWLAERQGDYAAAWAFHVKSLAIRRELDDRLGIAYSLANLAIVAFDQSDFATARALFEESLDGMRELGDRKGIAIQLQNLGTVAYEQGDYTAARALLEESLPILRDDGDVQHLANTLFNLGEVASAQDEVPYARSLLTQSLKLRQELGDRPGIAESLEGLGQVVSLVAGPEFGARIWGAAERLREQIDAPLPTHRRARYDRQVAAARAVAGEQRFALAWEEGRAMTLEQLVAGAMALRDPPEGLGPD